MLLFHKNANKISFCNFYAFWKCAFKSWASGASFHVLWSIFRQKLSILRPFEVDQWPRKRSRFKHKSLPFLQCRPENWKIPVTFGKSVDKKCFYNLPAISKCALEKWGLGASFDAFFIFFGAKLHILEPLEMKKSLEKKAILSIKTAFWGENR